MHKDFKKPKKILIIIQRSNGDVFLSTSLIKSLYENYDAPKIDLLINEDTAEVAKLLPNINYIHTFSYQKKATNRWSQEKELCSKLFRNYDLSINLTSSDRSVLYALVASKKSISIVEKDYKKSWWKQKLLSLHYYYDDSRHILIQNLTPLKLLKIKHDNLQKPIDFSSEDFSNIKNILKKKNIHRFIIFHPSAQYNFNVYPKKLRDKLLNFLNTLELPIIITGGNSEIDLNIKNEIPHLTNIYNFIGETTLKDYFILSELAMAYIGMDTLNMHIAASQNKRIFAIFGSTNIAMWSPWSNKLQTSALINNSLQTFGGITVFQSSFPCETCGKIGCGNSHGKNEFNFIINPEEIFNEVKKWLIKSEL